MSRKENGYIVVELAIASVMIVAGRKIHKEVADRIAQYFKETHNTSLYVFLEDYCSIYDKEEHLDYGLRGYFEVTSADNFIEIVTKNRDEFKDPDVPDHIVEFGCGVGKLYSMTEWIEHQYKEMMDVEYEQFYKRQLEDLEYEQWRSDNFDADGEYIGPEFV